MLRCFKNFPAALLQCRPAKQLIPTGSAKAIVSNKPTPVRHTLNQSGVAPRRGYSCPVMSGPGHGRTCAIPHAR
eukprot:3536234-Pyramimonas_sp.AAC.1